MTAARCASDETSWGTDHKCRRHCLEQLQLGLCNETEAFYKLVTAEAGGANANVLLPVADRRDHIVIYGGVNIYPREAEDLVLSHPKMLDAAVFGTPDDEMGQTVKGVAQTVDPADATDEFVDELLRWLRDRLTYRNYPRSLSFESQLPRTDTDKLYKQELVKKYSSQR